MARRLAERYGWCLMPPDDLARRAEEHLRAGLGRGPAEAVIGAYCVALHAACAGAEGADRRERGYTELADYLFSIACLRFRDLTEDQREDVTQATLERVVRTFGGCRQPVAFLAFAAQHLLDSARAARQLAHRPIESLDRAGDGDDGPQRGHPSRDDRDPVEEIATAERRAAIDRFLNEFLREHPRAAQQVDVLRLELIDGLDDAAIGAHLGLKPGSVHTARSRIRRTLRAEARWMARARELGLVPEEV